MINIKKILSVLVITCFIYPITINSELIEFNNKFFIPNDYNPFTGEVQDFYLKSNALKLEGNYLNGLKHGFFTHYFENGNVYKKENFLKGELVGDLLEFNRDGILIYKKSFKNDGFIYTSFYKDSKIKLVGEFIGEYMHGKWVEYHKNGSIKSEKIYNNGLIDSTKTKDYIDTLLSDDALKIKQSEFFLENQKGTSSLDFNQIEDGEHIIYSDKKNQKIIENYLNNKLNGSWTIFHESGRVLMKRFYDNGILDSSKQTLKFYESGNLMEKFNEIINDGTIVKSGVFNSFYENGVNKEVGFFYNGKKNSDWVGYYQTGEILYKINYDRSENLNPINFYYKSGELFYTCYLNDSFDYFGEYTSYYKSGEIMEKGRYDSNLKNGLWVLFYETGEILSQIDYVDGNGIYSKFFNTGEIQESGYFQNNKKEGLWINYYKNGNKKNIYKYKNDKININELSMHYNQEGFLEVEKLVKELDGLIINDGKYTSFYKDGSIKENGVYVNNLKVGLWIEFYNNSNIKSEIDFINGNGLFKEYYETGELLLKGKYINNKKNGKWEEFNIEGNKYREYYYLNDKVNSNRLAFLWYDSGYKKSEGYLMLINDKIAWDGDYIEYYENGIIYTEGSYDNGIKDGVWKEYYPNRSVKSIKYYKDGNPFGKWTFYNENGDVVKFENY